MDATYPLYAAAHPRFYDQPHRRGVEAAGLFAPVEAAEWETWSQVGDETWSFWMPPGVTLPEQGWKLHVSATPATADAVLATVSLHCNRHALPFKFLRDRRTLQATLGKEGDRRASGKFIAVYPTFAADLHSHLAELDAALAGTPGPYVLTDLRWNQGPVFVRYGAFTRQFVTVDGIDVPALRDLDTGVLVPDVRAPSFHVPPWVRVPEFLRAELDGRLDSTAPDGFPYVRGALHFSNAGGIYEAELEGLPVILKEARPHVGWTPDGRNAVQRLHDEARLLTDLQGRAPVPRVIATFTAHDHVYLAMDQIDAMTLTAASVARNPLAGAEPSLEARRAYRDWVNAVAASLRQAVTALHDAGHVHGDLHPGNVLVRQDDTVVLIDLEMSRPIADEHPGVLGAPGFVATDGRGALEQDLYALACIELFLYVPLIPLLNLDLGKLGELANEAAAQFELETSWVDDIVATLRRRETSTVPAGDATATPDNIARTLYQDASPERRDRLWPGDPAQFSEPSTSLAHGALGILTVLHHAGFPPAQDHLAWVSAAESAPGSPARAGLFDGLAGAVWAYRRMGLHAVADRHLIRLSTIRYDGLGFDLYSGLPGLGLTLLAESDRHPWMRRAALDIATRLRDRWREVDPPSQVATSAGGMLRGATGSALFAVRLFEVTGDPEHLRIATEAIDFDLRSLRAAADGALHVDEGWRLLPYLGTGSAGIGMVLAQLLTHLPGHSRYLEAVDGIARAATAPFTVQGGLFQGRAGLIQLLLTLERTGLASTATTAALHRHTTAMRLHTVRNDDEVRFVGDGLLRASCDLATGAAGVLGTLIDYDAMVHGLPHDSACVPYLTPVRGSTDHSPYSAARPGEGGEMNGVPLVAAGA